MITYASAFPRRQTILKTDQPADSYCGFAMTGLRPRSCSPPSSRWTRPAASPRPRPGSASGSRRSASTSASWRRRSAGRSCTATRTRWRSRRRRGDDRLRPHHPRRARPGRRLLQRRPPPRAAAHRHRPTTSRSPGCRRSCATSAATTRCVDFDLTVDQSGMLHQRLENDRLDVFVGKRPRRRGARPARQAGAPGLGRHPDDEAGPDPAPPAGGLPGAQRFPRPRCSSALDRAASRTAAPASAAASTA